MRRVAFVGALSVLVAGLSLLLHAVPGFDAQGWLLWGREITGGGLGALSTTAYPSWKPLPALITTPLSLTGTAAPALWLLVERTGAVVAAVLAYRLAARLAGPVAGVIAVAGLLLLDQWWTYAARGAIEPLLAALLLGAVDRHLAGRRGQAAALLALAGLGRPEALVLYALYGLLLVVERPVRAVGLGAGGAAVVGLWLGGDDIGSGDPLHGSFLARRAQEAVMAQRAGDVAGATLHQVVLLVGVPLLAAGAVALLLAWRRGETSILMLGAGAVVWLAVDVVMALRGYPPLGRFMIPAGALVCVAAAVGLVWLVRARAPAPVPGWAAGMAVALALVPLAVAAPGRVSQQVRDEAAYVRAADGLDVAVAHAHGVRRILAQGWISTMHAFQTRLAWRLGVSSSEVGRRTGSPGIAFNLGPRPYPGLQKAMRTARVRKVERIDGWTIYDVVPRRPA